MTDPTNAELVHAIAERLGVAVDARASEAVTDEPRTVQLEDQVAELRRELDEVRTQLAEQQRLVAGFKDGTGVLHVVSILVGDDHAPSGDHGSTRRRVEINPGAITVSDDTNGCHVSTTARDGYSAINVVAGDVVGRHESEHVAVMATMDYDFEPGGRRAFIELISDSPHVQIMRTGDQRIELDLVELVDPLPVH